MQGFGFFGFLDRTSEFLKQIFVVLFLFLWIPGINFLILFFRPPTSRGMTRLSSASPSISGWVWVGFYNFFCSGLIFILFVYELLTPAACEIFRWSKPCLSVSSLWHFGADPDPRIRTSDHCLKSKFWVKILTCKHYFRPLTPLWKNGRFRSRIRTSD